MDVQIDQNRTIAIESALGEMGVPSRDADTLPTSNRTFPDGGHYRIEISGVERLSTLQTMCDAQAEYGVPVHRIIACVGGSTLVSKHELRDMAQLLSARHIEAVLTPGPRRAWDLGPQYRTAEGVQSGARTRGAAGLRDLILDIDRGLDAGFRGFLIMDEGVLWVASQLRERGIFPADTYFKVSVYAGHGNPAGAIVLERLGASSINPLADLTLGMLAAMRQAVSIPLDIYVYLVDAMGGFVRVAEAAEIVRVSSPCYLKFEPGLSEASVYAPYADESHHQQLIRQKVRFAAITQELIADRNPSLRTSNQDGH